MSIFIHLFLLFFTVHSLDIHQCNRPLGMKSNRIKDDQISVSSSFDDESTGQQHSRLSSESGGGAWCPKYQTNSTSNEWIQISFEQDTVITAVETQGRYGGGNGVEYASAYRIEYWRPTLKTWAQYKDGYGNQIIQGNSDTSTAVIRILDGAIIARRIRIIPLSNSTRTVCMRIELHGCSYQDNIKSYSIIDGNYADGLSLRDVSFDGIHQNNILSNGLGKLFDGKEGSDDFERFPESWIGWRNNYTNSFITLNITFYEQRNISEILIHTSNQYKHHAQAFTRAVISFSQGGDHFSNRQVIFDYPPDYQFETSRWIRISIPYRLATQIMIQLYMSPISAWLLLSEIQVESTAQPYILIPHHDETFPYGSMTSTQDSETHDAVVQFILYTLAVVIALSIGLTALCCIHNKKNKVKAASPSPSFNARNKEIRLTMHGNAIKRISPSAYQMVSDNAANALLEKVPSDYAEADVNSYREGSVPLLTSFQNQGLDVSHYAATDIICNMTLRKAVPPPPAVVQYSDYGEVYNTTLQEINRSKLQFIEKIGQGEFGEVNLCRLDNEMVAVKKLIGKSDDDEIAFQREIRVLGTLDHPNVVSIIGVCSIEKPMLCIMEHMPNGDLKTFLSNKEDIDAAYCLSVCTQLAAGLAYLESCNFVHRDIAARNCLVDGNENVKISDFGMTRSLYASEYYILEGEKARPIRWMAWESLLLGRFSTASDVWSFGVTMWEIYSLCREKPFSNLTDNDVILNLQQYHATGHMIHLPRPSICPSGVFSMMSSCYHREPASRPSFHSLHLHLQSSIHTPELLQSI